MGVSFPSEKGINGFHVGAMRVLSLPPSQLLKDPLAPVKSQHNRQRPLQGIFHERLSGPLASLQKPPTPRPATARRSKSSREPRSNRPAWGTFALPSVNKENLEVREAHKRVASDGSWSGDLIRLTSALDQLAALCHNGPKKNGMLRKKSGLQRYPDPYLSQEETLTARDRLDSFGSREGGSDVNFGGFSTTNLSNSYDYKPSYINSSTVSSHPNSLSNSDSLEPLQEFTSPQTFDREWDNQSPVHNYEPLNLNPAVRPPLQLPPCPVEGLRPSPIVHPITVGMTRKMGIVLRALGERLASWSRGEGAVLVSQGSQHSASTSSSPISVRHQVQTTPTPSPAQSNGTMMPGTPGGAFVPFRRKVVVALYDYNAAQVGDLCLRKNEEFDVLDDSEEHWWKIRDNQGREGYAPSNYVREKGNLGLQQYDWYLGDASRQRAEAILMREEKEGCFVVRNSTTNSGIYTLSVFSKMSRVQVKHYHIKTDPDGMFYLSNSIKCATIPDLIYRHQHNPGGLCTRLRNPPSQGRQAPTTAGLSHDKWEIVPSELNLMEELGSGQFGVVRHAKLYGIDVAVKMMKEGTMSEDEFIEEAKVMTKLQHPNLVQLYGVCRRKRPIYIVTEYLKHGSLLNFLRNKEKLIIQKTDALLDMCLQVCEGMAYLEGQKFIHRDLAARNCLVGSNNLIKVGDFGLARYVVDDEYTGSGGAKFPIKWAAPEVLNYMRFSSKSDVWAFGVLMWEVSTCGKMPYGRHKNAEVVEMVQQGKILDRPRYCPPEVYDVMRKCWLHSQEQRPGFQDIKTELTKVVKMIAD